ncbi:uncharacterized protein isoform X1 [Salmo salar]|uniref:Uncharacterized protein isoform X1 n=1 Tax=Salmo salar TaxID=8030 RepID=A0ABM3DEJ9_SALSA|nr:uncharacterized protein LOC123728724 isoform X1 [Salmo salar]
MKAFNWEQAQAQHNQTRKKAGTAKGDLQYKQIFCKRWVVKKVYEPRTHYFRERLVHLTVEQRKDQRVVYKEPESQLPKLNIPANIATAPKPAKPAAMTQHKTRFTS